MSSLPRMSAPAATHDPASLAVTLPGGPERPAAGGLPGRANLPNLPGLPGLPERPPPTVPPPAVPPLTGPAQSEPARAEPDAGRRIVPGPSGLGTKAVGVPARPVAATAALRRGRPTAPGSGGRIPLGPIGVGPNRLGLSALDLLVRPLPADAPEPATTAALTAPATPAVLPGREGPPKPGEPIPGLYYHPVPEPDPERVAEVGRQVKAWALDEVQLYPPEWEDQFDGFALGRYMVACHPDAPTVEHLMLATRLMAAENVVDDCYCEDHGGSPVGLGGRLLLAHTALDPLHTTEEYRPSWEESLHADAPRRAYRSAMDYFSRAATPSQADRFRHDMARLHLGYLAEAAWAETGYSPQVWEYLAMRQFNNFRPCPTITDTVGGYVLPADLHALPAMQRVIALASNATTIVNDLYSYTKELAAPGKHLNLPVVIAEREGCGDREAYLKAVEVHNDLMHAFEAAAATLALTHPDPAVLRFLRGVAAWVDGNHHWHCTNTYRYSLPDFW